MRGVGGAGRCESSVIFEPDPSAGGYVLDLLTADADRELTAGRDCELTGGRDRERTGGRDSVSIGAADREQTVERLLMTSTVCLRFFLFMTLLMTLFCGCSAAKQPERDWIASTLVQNGDGAGTGADPAVQEDGALSPADNIGDVGAGTVVYTSYTDLSVPTQITKIVDEYFIVDCYHNRIIYNDDLSAPLDKWRVMTDEMKMGHSLASDGTVYIADDTENERIMIFEKQDDRFVFTQVFEGISDRPHYIVYNEEDGLFYAWASTGGRMCLLKRDGGDNRVYIVGTKSIPELDGVYVRTFTLMGDDIYFPAANGIIIRADRESFEVKERFRVPDTMAGMIQLSKIGDMFYITVSTDLTGFQEFATIVRCRELAGLEKGEYEDVYESFIGGGTPYVITSFDGAFFLTEHRIPGHSIWRFVVDDGDIRAETLY